MIFFVFNNNFNITISYKIEKKSVFCYVFQRAKRCVQLNLFIVADKKSFHSLKIYLLKRDIKQKITIGHY